MKIPTRIHRYGDKDKAQQLVGFGKKVLSKFEESLSFRNIKNGRDSIRLSDGSIINVFVNFDETRIDIISPISDGEVLEEDWCLCGEFFAEGVVVGITEVPGYVTPARLYTVDVCQYGNTQITVGNCVSHEFHDFSIGDRVWCSLDIREAIPLHPFFNNYTILGSPPDFAFSTPWGALGERRGFTYVACTDISGNYTNRNSTLSISNNAKGPCLTPLSMLDSDWPGVYPRMCGLKKDISSCFWMYKSLTNYFIKNEKSLYSEYSMLTTIGGSIDPAKDYSVTWLFNLQIIPQ